QIRGELGHVLPVRAHGVSRRVPLAVEMGEEPLDGRAHLQGRRPAQPAEAAGWTTSSSIDAWKLASRTSARSDSFRRRLFLSRTRSCSSGNRPKAMFVG